MSSSLMLASGSTFQTKRIKARPTSCDAIRLLRSSRSSAVRVWADGPHDGPLDDVPQLLAGGRLVPGDLRQALFAWAFNPATCDTSPPPGIGAALDWAEGASLPVAELEDTATVRLALAACARNLNGKPAARSTQRRKRSVFYNALGYAVEQGHLASNPVDRIQWTAPAVAQTVDRRVVVSPAQASTLLAAVRGLSGRGGGALEAFYGCLYYAALRPSEAVMLRESDLHLPKRGWGRIVLAASASRAGTAWTDHGTARQERGLKHRADHETRTIPSRPNW